MKPRIRKFTPLNSGEYRDIITKESNPAMTMDAAVRMLHRYHIQGTGPFYYPISESRLHLMRRTISNGNCQAQVRIYLGDHVTMVNQHWEKDCLRTYFFWDLANNRPLIGFENETKGWANRMVAPLVPRIGCLIYCENENDRLGPHLELVLHPTDFHYNNFLAFLYGKQTWEISGDLSSFPKIKVPSLRCCVVLGATYSYSSYTVKPGAGNHRERAARQYANMSQSDFDQGVREGIVMGYLSLRKALTNLGKAYAAGLNFRVVCEQYQEQYRYEASEKGISSGNQPTLQSMSPEPGALHPDVPSSEVPGASE